MTREGLKALADTAFVGTTRNISAIGKLTVALGEARTLELAKTYGIEKLFSKEKGIRPTGNDDILDEYVEVANDEAAEIDAKQSQTVAAGLERPLHDSISTSETNGWSRHPKNIRVNEDGSESWSPRALKLQAGTLRLGPRVAAEVAARSGSTVGAPYPPKARDAHGRFKGA
jgi:hypothetical protein